MIWYLFALNVCSLGLVNEIPFRCPASIQEFSDFSRRHFVMRVACCLFFYGVFESWNHVPLNYYKSPGNLSQDYKSKCFVVYKLISGKAKFQNL